MIVIKEVKTRKDLRNFVRVPYGIFKGCNEYVPPLEFDEMNTLDRDKNPVFDFCDARYFIAYDDDLPVGRIATIINHAYNKKTNQKYLRIGWFDFPDNQAVSKALFDIALEVARENGLNKIHGPLGFTDFDKQGLLVKGHKEKSTIISLYNHPYYAEHFEKLGLKKDVDWVEMRFSVEKVPEKLEKFAEIVKTRYNVKILDIKNKKHLKEIAYKIFEIWNEEFSILYGYVPVEGRLLDNYIDQYFGYIDPKYVAVLADSEDNPIGFGISVPSLSDAFIKAKGKLLPLGFIHILNAMKHPEIMDLYTIGVTGKYQKKGVVSLILVHTLNKYIENGIHTALASAMLEENKNVLSLWKFFEGEEYKRRRCYVYELTKGKEERGDRQ